MRNATSGVTQASYNNVNELTGLSPGGSLLFQGTTNKAIKSASVVNGSNYIAATLAYAKSFSANGIVPSGSSQSTVSAIDGANNTTSIPVQHAINGGTSSTLKFDANGNMTSDGTNTYKWDAENRLIQITYPGTGNYSQFSYDGLYENVKTIEAAGGVITSTKQFVWSKKVRCEERDVSGNLTKQFHQYGENVGAQNYYYFSDHLKSVRETTDSSGIVQSEVAYDPYGRRTVLQGAITPDKQFDGYYFHPSSGLYLTFYRFYSPFTGRWSSRDPLGALGGYNLYSYVKGNPISFSDPLGLQGGFHQGNWCGQGWASGQWIDEDDPNLPIDENDPFFAPPDRDVPYDVCCYKHDICIHKASFNPDPYRRQCERAECDKQATNCFHGVQQTLTPGTYDWAMSGFLSWLFTNLPNNRPGKYNPPGSRTISLMAE